MKSDLKDKENKKGYIYKLTAPNGKIYIGQTINKNNRKSHYRSKKFKAQIKLWNSCEKHNWNPVDTFEIIEECFYKNNINVLNEREVYWIKEFGAFGPNGLNCGEGGKGNFGYKTSEKTKEKLRQINLGKKHSEETKKKISEANRGEKNKFYGRKHSKETKEKLKFYKLGIKQSEETIIKRAKSNTGKKRTNETKEKIRIGNLGKKRSEESKKNMSIAHIGIPLIGKNAKGYKMSEDIKKKISNNKKGKSWTEARRQAQNKKYENK